jgi:hypothetical protein
VSEAIWFKNEGKKFEANVINETINTSIRKSWNFFNLRRRLEKEH